MELGKAAFFTTDYTDYTDFTENMSVFYQNSQSLKRLTP